MFGSHTHQFGGHSTRQERAGRRTFAVALPTLALAVAGPALADEAGDRPSEAERQALIEEALSAAPPGLENKVEVRDLEGNLLREGEGAFTCLPAPTGIAGPMCLDEQWLAWMDAWPG